MALVVKESNFRRVKEGLSPLTTPLLRKYVNALSPDAIKSLYKILYTDCNKYIEMCNIVEELDDMILCGWGISFKDFQRIKDELEKLY